MAGAKRARAAAFSEHERYMHKSGVVLQREGKKIRAFLVRKAVAQLKQAREQHASATTAVETLGDADDKKRKRVEGKAKKLFYQVEKLEKELAALKTLDLKAVVAQAFEKTGLKKEEKVESDDDESDREMSAHDREMYKYGRGRSEHETHAQEEEDDGFNSEDYDEVPRSEASDSSDSDDDDENDDKAEDEEVSREDDGDAKMHGDDEQEGAMVYGPQGPPGESLDQDAESSPSVADPALVEQLVERVLTHNQMQPFLDAIRQYVEKRERDNAKKRRQKEKKALKRARASMIGGRSMAAPTSMFFGSLSGDAPDDDEPVGASGYDRASMAGAEDDIADFLGETKKKKNRPGQMARRQKAMRLEEERRRAEEGGDSGKRRFHDRGPATVGKYGLSERPKKQQKKDAPSRGGKKDGDRPASWKERGDKQVGRGSKPESDGKHQDRRGRPDAHAQAPKPKAPVPQRKVEDTPSHPSWLAKQALKEKMKVDINAFSGKKITFGDD